MKEPIVCSNWDERTEKSFICREGEPCARWYKPWLGWGHGLAPRWVRQETQMVLQSCNFPAFLLSFICREESYESVATNYDNYDHRESGWKLWQFCSCVIFPALFVSFICRKDSLGPIKTNNGQGKSWIIRLFSRSKMFLLFCVICLQRGGELYPFITNNDQRYATKTHFAGG